VVTTRLHGLVLALRHGVPALAVDPVAGADKVSAQAHAWQWPALVAAESVVRDRRGTAVLQDWWRWSLPPRNRQLDMARAAAPHPPTSWWVSFWTRSRPRS
jgi:polysaccharide pyruvyl transferase WcaK-like protein